MKPTTPSRRKRAVSLRAPRPTVAGAASAPPPQAAPPQPGAPAPVYPPGSPPPAAEYGLRRAYAARLGMSQAQFEQLFGSPANPHSRAQAAQDCAAWARQLPKARGAP